MGLRHTKSYEASEFLYIGLYVYYRLFQGIFIVYNTTTTSVGHPIVKAIAVGVAIQSYFYVVRMGSIVTSRMKEIRERKKEGVALYWFTHNPKVEKLSYFQKSKKKENIP
jgi:MFS superfamily sulfate permease-like transporter